MVTGLSSCDLSSSSPLEAVPSRLGVVPAMVELAAPGDTIRLTARLGSGNAEVEWRSTNPRVAIAFPNGKVVARGAGEAVITAHHANGHSAKVPAHVRGGKKDKDEDSNSVGNQLDQEVVLSESDIELTAIGDTLTVFATIVVDSSEVDEPVSWKSEDTDIVRVDRHGTLTARAPGITYVVADADCCTEEKVKVTVRQVVTAVAVTAGALTLQVGETTPVSAKASDANGHEVSGASFTWSSSDADVASVSDGVVNGVAAGAATISAGVDSVKGSESFTVEEQTDARSPAASSGIWISAEEIARLPTSGAAWDRIRSQAAADFGPANISDMSSKHDTHTFAAALVCVRTSEYCSKAVQGVLDAIGTEEEGRWLEVGRNLGGYVIAADLLGLRADGNVSSRGTRVENWIRSWLTRELPDNVTREMRPFGPFHSGSNAAAQEGFAFSAVAAYLDDETALLRAWDAFRTFVCDQDAPDYEGIDLNRGIQAGWAHDDRQACAVNPRGTVKQVPLTKPGGGGTYRIDGAIINDQRRGGDFQWEPGFTPYPWTGLAGLVPAAVVLQRAGHPAFSIADRAVLRTLEYLWVLREETGDGRWFDGSRGSEIIQLANHYYGTAYPTRKPVSVGHTMGFTDWTHAAR